MNNDFMLLGSILADNKKFNEIKKHGNIFQDKDCKKLFDIVINLDQKSNGFTKQTIIDFLQESKDFSVSTFFNIYDCGFDSNQYKIYFNEVLKNFFKNKFQELYHRIFMNEYKNHIDIKYELISFANKISDNSEIEINDSKDICRKMLERLATNYKVPKIYSGIDYIDNQQGGYDLTDYIVIGAGESVGKTSYIISRMILQAKQGLKIGFFSCEMLRDKIYQLMACSLRGIDSGRVDQYMLSEKEKSDYLEAIAWLYEKDFYVIDKIRYFDEIKTRIKILKEEKKIDIIYIDYLQYLRVSGIKTQYERIEHISTEIKELCKEIQTPIVLIASLNREGKKAGRPPECFDIKGNGDVEYDADVVILMNEIDKAVNGNSNIRMIDFLVRKNRNGRQGEYRQMFYPAIRKFSDIKNF